MLSDWLYGNLPPWLTGTLATVGDWFTPNVTLSDPYGYAGGTTSSLVDQGDPADYHVEDPFGIYKPGGLYDTFKNFNLDTAKGLLGQAPTLGTVDKSLYNMSAADIARYSQTQEQMLAQLYTPEYIAQQKALQEQQAYYDAAVRGYDPNAYMTLFNSQAGGLSDLVNSRSGALGSTLEQIANRQSRLGGEAALASMPGMRNSGAAMAAFGQAYADPFANAQAQLQQNQLQGTMSLWEQAMRQNADNYNAQLAANTNMAGGATSGLNSLVSGTQNNLANLITNQNTNYANLSGMAAQNYANAINNNLDNYTSQLGNYNSNATSMWGAAQNAAAMLGGDSTYLYEPTYIAPEDNALDWMAILMQGLGIAGDFYNDYTKNQNAKKPIY
jgi:hypothetical protein